MEDFQILLLTREIVVTVTAIAVLLRHISSWFPRKSKKKKKHRRRRK